MTFRKLGSIGTVTWIVFGWLCRVSAEDSTVIRTNTYAVTGATIREIRADLARKRPWKSELDGYTAWKVDWSYRTERTESGCRLQSIDVRTEITITIPRWTPPADADPQTKANWATYIKGLLAHEDGHKRIALAAANEVRTRVKQVPAAATCRDLDASLKREANKAVEEFKRREKLYDERTDHGRKDGATFR
jgi:predicted secreted Zn-dependent protease